MRFAAFRAPWYKGYLAGGSLVMAGDNAEHAITYWVMWQTFHSPLLAGFAVISHWLPHLFFSVFFGSLADRFDCRRIIQVAIGIFAAVSVTWGVLFATGTLQAWHAVLLLVAHGFASALWHPADGVLVYDIVGPEAVGSGVRLMATGLSLGQLLGPAAGAALLFTVGPAIGMFVNLLFYVPFAVYLLVMPIDGHRRRRELAPRVRLRDVVGVLRDLPRYPTILVVVLLQGAVAFFIGTAVMPLLPEFGALLGQDTSGLGYGMLIVAMSTGAVVGGVTLEAVGRIPASARLAIASTLVFAISIGVFAFSRTFVVSLVVLFLAGASTLASSSISQTLVQLDAPPDRRGRFIGAYGMTSMGLRIGSGVLIGGIGLLVGAPLAVGIDAGLLALVAAALLMVVLTSRRDRRRMIEVVIPEEQT
ncbi:MAG TPA: MFS transporter [Pseudolysinimonas sp.]|nr:MFS transporter [Pseudolysinimonas sp.]